MGHGRMLIISYYYILYTLQLSRSIVQYVKERRSIGHVDVEAWEGGGGPGRNLLTTILTVESVETSFKN
jgi:hypothetical protein